jgi:chitinase
MRSGSIKKVLISLGGAGSAPDFDAIKANFSGFASLAVPLFKSLGIDGLDIDIEDDMTPYQGVLAQLAELAVNNSWTLTMPPCCTSISQYVDLVKATTRKDPVTGATNCSFDYMMVQTYGDGPGSADEYKVRGAAADPL